MWQAMEHEHSLALDSDGEIRCTTCGELDCEDIDDVFIDPQLLLEVSMTEIVTEYTEGELQDAVQALNNISGVEAAVTSREKTMPELVTDLQAAMDQFNVAKGYMATARADILNIQEQLRGVGVNVEVMDMFTGVGGYDSDEFVETVVHNPIPGASLTRGPKKDSGGIDILDPTVIARERAARGIRPDVRDSAEVVSEAHAGIVEDPTAQEAVLAAGYESSVARGMQEAEKKMADNSSGPIDPLLPQLAGRFPGMEG